MPLRPMQASNEYEMEFSPFDRTDGPHDHLAVVTNSCSTAFI
jgi:hypothetical protein